jgi:hypothetical protein
MEFMGKTRIETYHPKPVTGSSPQFIRVYYGWWSFSFARSAADAGLSFKELRESAEAQAHALLLLDDTDTDYLSWRSILKQHMNEAVVKLNPAPKEQFKWKGRK